MNIIEKSQNFNNNKELIKKQGVVFTPFSICNKIIELLKPDINDIICEPSVGKGVFIFALLEYFKKKYDIIEIVNFIENRLYCYDINEEFINEFKLLLQEYLKISNYNHKLNLNNIKCSDFLFNDDMYFDIILGNPPYVKIQNLDKNYLTELKNNFNTFKNGNCDLYYAFIEKSLNVSKKLAFIVPNSWIKSKSGVNLRNIIKDRLNYLYDFENNKVWSNISTYTSIILINEQSHDLIYETEKDIITLDKNLFTDKWLNKKRVTNKKLKDLFYYTNGSVATLADNIYKIDKIDRKYTIDNDLLVKYVKATKMKSFYDYGMIIYPYRSNKPILRDDMIEKYTNTWNYLLDNQEQLFKRDSGKFRYKNEWWVWGRKQGLLKETLGIKVILPITFLRSNGIHYIIIPENENCVVLSGIIIDVKKEHLDEFITIISSDEFYDYCENNNKIMKGKNSEDKWLTLNTTTINNYCY
jgi:adenine-specific DNA-methyltransferase